MYQYVLAPNRPHNFLFIVLHACICCFFPTGIVALVYACQVSICIMQCTCYSYIIVQVYDQYNAGDYTKAERSSKLAYRFTKISIVIGISLAIAISIWFIVMRILIVFTK